MFNISLQNKYRNNDSLTFPFDIISWLLDNFDLIQHYPYSILSAKFKYKKMIFSKLESK